MFVNNRIVLNANRNKYPGKNEKTRNTILLSNTGLSCAGMVGKLG